jgi:hypothetical protein
MAALVFYSSTVIFLYRCVCFACWALLNCMFYWPASRYIYKLYIYSIPPDNGLQICPKHVGVDWRNKLRINSASSWFLLLRYIEMHSKLKKGGTSCASMSAVVTRTHYIGTWYVHFLSRYLAQIDKVAPMMDRNDPTLASDYGALGLTPWSLVGGSALWQLSTISIDTCLRICTAWDQALIVRLSVARINSSVLHSTIMTDFAVELRRDLRSGKSTVRCMWPVTGVFQFKTHRPEVRSSFF